MGSDRQRMAQHQLQEFLPYAVFFTSSMVLDFVFLGQGWTGTGILRGKILAKQPMVTSNKWPTWMAHMYPAPWGPCTWRKASCMWSIFLKETHSHLQHFIHQILYTGHSNTTVEKLGPAEPRHCLVGTEFLGDFHPVSWLNYWTKLVTGFVVSVLHVNRCSLWLGSISTVS